MKRVAESWLVAIVAVAALLSCDDGESELTNAQFPGRRSFDDGRELFFSKPGRDVRWLSWAPDGRRFVYVDSVGKSDLRINVYDTATREDRVLLEGPYGGIDHDVRECIHHGGSEYIEGGYQDEKWGWGTEYYDDALDWAIVIHDGGDGGSRALAAAAPALRLAQNAPNPATSSTTIRLELSSREATRAELVIYDLSGRRVRTFDVPVRDGLAEVAWDLTTSAGARVAPGVYIYRVSAGGFAAAKMCVVH